MTQSDTNAATLYRRWRRLLDGLGVKAPTGDGVFTDLIRAYCSPERHYHDLRHLDAVLTVLEYNSAAARDLAAVELAAWFHDAVYDPRANDNEERSAVLAAEALTGLAVEPSRVAEVRRLVLLTREHRAADDDDDGVLLLDADLSILGADEAEYLAYAAAIRREYAWVPEAAYREGRAAVLRRFLGRERIYRTPALAEALETRGRRNLEGELDRLLVTGNS